MGWLLLLLLQLDVDDSANMALLGAAAAAYATRGEVPVVQVVEHDLLTPKALLQPPLSTGTSSSSSNGKTSPSDKSNGKGGGSSGGSSNGSSGGSSSSKVVAGAAGSGAAGAGPGDAGAGQQQQQQQQLQPQMAYAGATASAGDVPITASTPARNRGECGGLLEASLGRVNVSSLATVHYG
jgi:hypothetical protein